MAVWQNEGPQKLLVRDLYSLGIIRHSRGPLWQLYRDDSSFGVMSLGFDFSGLHGCSNLDELGRRFRIPLH